MAKPKKDLLTEMRKTADRVLKRVLDRHFDEIFATYREVVAEAAEGKTAALPVSLGLKFEPHKGDVKVRGSISFGVKVKDEHIDFASEQDPLPGMERGGVDKPEA